MQVRSLIPSCRMEAQRQRRRQRRRQLAQLAGLVLLGTAGYHAALDAWLDHREAEDRAARARGMSLAEALWVTDRDITRIYAPGTPQQEGIVEQFLAAADISGNDSAATLRFDRPVLYRMGMASSADPAEGILIAPFDPRQPEMAWGMKAGR